jgi:hypothetical protein
VCSEGLNSHNKSKQDGTSTKYYGVHFENFSQKFRAEIKHEGIKYRLGRFKEEADAVNAYNKKAIELYGSGANLNII